MWEHERRRSEGCVVQVRVKLEQAVNSYSRVAGRRAARSKCRRRRVDRCRDCLPSAPDGQTRCAKPHPRHIFASLSPIKAAVVALPGGQRPHAHTSALRVWCIGPQHPPLKDPPPPDRPILRPLTAPSLCSGVHPDSAPAMLAEAPSAPTL